MKINILIAVCFFSMHAVAQTEIVNPKGKWFFGAEIGVNTIMSFHRGESENSFQGGILAEYYYAKHWSVSGRVKYFKTGLSSREEYQNFNGSVISVPVNLKWDFRIMKNFRGNIKTGFALNQEIKSDYDYFEGADTDFPKCYISFNPGFGLSYFLNTITAVYMDYECYVSASDRDNDDFDIGILNYSPINSHINFGVKYNFSK